jgi:hypothetical protein
VDALEQLVEIKWQEWLLAKAKDKSSRQFRTDVGLG